MFEILAQTNRKMFWQTPKEDIKIRNAISSKSGYEVSCIDTQDKWGNVAYLRDGDLWVGKPMGPVDHKVLALEDKLFSLADLVALCKHKKEMGEENACEELKAI